MNMPRTFVVILVIVLQNFSESARILAVFPTPSISHQVVFRPLMHELARRGHDVVIITTDPAFPKGQAPANLTEIDVHDISYEHSEKFLTPHRGNKNEFIFQILTFFGTMPTIIDSQLQVPAVKKILSQEKDKFDLLIIEACARAAMGFSHAFKTPMIQISSLGVTAAQYMLLGSPIQPFLYPTAFQQRIYNLSLFEKIKQIFSFIKIVQIIWSTEGKDNSVARKHFGEDMPRFEDLFLDYTQMLFVNEHPLWGGNRPVSPNILYIGGIHQNPDKPLPKDLKSYLDVAQNGVIYVSFGTNVMPSMLDPKKIKIMVNVLSNLPYNVVWKWEGKLPGLSKNIRIFKWLPQSDLLKHPNVKLFITQGGLQSTDEAINAAVPLLGIPMLADQWFNTEKYVHHKIGIQIDFTSMDENILNNSIQSIIKNESYKENIMRFRDLIREYPVKPLDLAVWWTEHIIKYGGEHLRPPGAGKWFLDYYEIPLVLTVLLIFLSFLCIVSLILFMIVSYVKRMVFGKFKKKTN